MTFPPSQSHSATSVASARALSPTRVKSQEKWVYETLRRHPSGLADWQLWGRAPGTLFDKLSSMHRARIGLVWRSRVLGATPWHPVEDSGRRCVDPTSNKQTVVWRLKDKFLGVPYDDWARVYRDLAKGLVL